jgi:transcriptional regulator with XRE-family HTH domain
LREARKAAGLTGERLAARCGISQSKISKIETGRVLASVTDVERILTALGARQDLTDELLALTRLANTGFENVRASLKRGLHKKQRELAALEADATHIHFFLPTMITGLLQTPEYARASLAVFPGDHSQAIARRLERQAALYNRAKRFTFLLTEAAVRWQLVEPAIMAVQMGHLSSLSELPNVRLGIIPLDKCIPDGPLNTFTVYDERIATAETFGGVIMMRDPRDVAYHLDLFNFFAGYAVFNDTARSLLEKYTRAFRRPSLRLSLFRYGNYSVTGIYHIDGKGPLWFMSWVYMN